MPNLVFIIGHAGCGKTTIAKLLAKKHNYVFLDRDTIGSLFIDKMLSMKGLNPDDRDSEIYHREFRDIEYAAMLEVAIENLNLGNDVMMISPFTKEVNNEDWIEDFIKSNNLENIDTKVISVYLSDIEAQRKRIIERKTSRDNWKIENWELYKEKLKKIVVKWNGVKTHYFDNSPPLSSNILTEIDAFLEK